MKMIALVLAVVALVGVNVRAKSGENSDIVEPVNQVRERIFGEHFYWLGHQYSLLVSFSELQATPTWDPENQSELPISLEKAISLALQKLKVHVDTSSDFVISTIELKRYGITDFWFYKVCFSKRSRFASDPDENFRKGLWSGVDFRYIVLMSGKVVEPQQVDAGKEVE